MTRVINPDSTVASETQAGRTTTFEYDLLGRVRWTRPPGADPIETIYTATTVTTARGQSATVATLDGFGRPVETLNAAGVRTVTRYDPLGRVEYQSLPFGGAGEGTGTAFEYDRLGRVETEDPPGDGVRTFTYVAGAHDCAGVATVVTEVVTDTETRTTELCRLGLRPPRRRAAGERTRRRAEHVELHL